MQDTIGRPGGWRGLLWTLGNVYNTGMRGLDGLRKLTSFLLIVPSVRALLMMSLRDLHRTLVGSSLKERDSIPHPNYTPPNHAEI